MAIRFTVFTPTYNRAHTLDRLYQSLQRQTFKDFEWIVIDDGSTDRTEERFTQILHEDNFFQITYQKVENGGKHRAINKAVKMAAGELFFIADSDDYLTDDALEIVDRVERSIPEDKKSQFAGVCGLDGFDEQTIVGSSFAGGGHLDIRYIELDKYNISGDRKEVFYTEILSRYPFPEFAGETFINEGLIWNKMAVDGYMLRYFNRIIYICEYQSDGLSSNDSRLINSPKGWAYTINMDIEMGVLKGRKIWDIRNWYYNSLKNVLSIHDISQNLKVNEVTLVFVLVIRRIIRKLCGRR